MNQMEITCTSPKCDSCVPDAFGPGAHFWHWQLVKGVTSMCPVCRANVYERREVSFDQRFALGEITITPGVEQLIDYPGELFPYLQRHATGDWGDLDPEDVAANNTAISNEADILMRTRVMSVYEVKGEKVWVFTEAGRHNTTFLLPEEY